MSTRITPDHLGRAAVVYVRQSTMAQVMGNLESQRRQYDLAKAAEAAGFASVTSPVNRVLRDGEGWSMTLRSPITRKGVPCGKVIAPLADVASSIHETMALAWRCRSACWAAPALD